jgi:hypothetical protein
MLFHDIVTHDYARPLKARAASRKVVGPYHWTPRDPAKSGGFGFYCASKGLAMDAHGSICDLRLEWANDLLPSGSRLAFTNGYYYDRYQDTTLAPIVARLPHNRGFLAGWTMGQSMCAGLSTVIHETAEEAARAAHSEAECAAERQREFEEAAHR